MGEEYRSMLDDPSACLHSESTIIGFIEEIVRGVPMRPREERRATPRYSIESIVDVQPLDDAFRPVGEPYRAITRDISMMGIGLLDSRPVHSKHLAVRLTRPDGKTLSLIMEVLRCRPTNTIYDIGGKFVTQPDAND